MVRAKAPPSAPDSVKPPLPLAPTVLAAVMVTLPLIVAAVALLLSMALLGERPVPATWKLLARVWPLTSTAAPLITVTRPVPNVVLLPAVSVLKLPTSKVVPPL